MQEYLLRDLQLNSLDNQVGTYVEEIMKNPNNFCGIYADVGRVDFYCFS